MCVQEYMWRQKCVRTGQCGEGGVCEVMSMCISTECLSVSGMASCANHHKSIIALVQVQVFYLSGTQNNTRSDWALKFLRQDNTSTWHNI